MDDRFIKGTKYEIFIGLKDKDSYQETFTIDDFKDALISICTEKEINFSLLTQLGGYKHNKGYTTETSLRIIIIGINYDEVIKLGDWLKQKINTDTILVTSSDIEYAFI